MFDYGDESSRERGLDDDPVGLVDDYQLIEDIKEADRQIAAVSARQVTLLAEFARRRPGDDPRAMYCDRPSPYSTFAADEIGMALRLSRGSAANRLGQAVQLTRSLPATLALWEKGGLDLPKVRAICDILRYVPDPVADAVQEAVLPGAPEQTLSQLRSALARAIIAADPDGAADRHRSARQGRRVELGTEHDGMASIWALLAAPDALSVYEWLSRLARSLGKDDPRTMDARRADLLVALLTGNLTLIDELSADEPPDDPDPAGPYAGDADQYPADADAGSPPGPDLGTDLAAPAAATAPAPASAPTMAPAPAPAPTGAPAPAPTAASAPAPAPSAAPAPAPAAHASAPAPDVTAGPTATPEPAPTGVPTTAGHGGRHVTDHDNDNDNDNDHDNAAIPDPDPDPDVDPDHVHTDSGVPDPPPTSRGTARSPAPPGKPLIHIVMPFTTLIGADDQPCELTGYGPITADMAREIAADGVLKRLVTDPVSGALLDHGRTTYRPPAALADYVRARDVECRSPICRRRAQSCELDHTIAWADGGTTAEPNLWAGCPHHHHGKHAPGWTVVQHPDGRIEWITPTGHRYVSNPFAYPTDPGARPARPEPPPEPGPPEPDEPCPF